METVVPARDLTTSPSAESTSSDVVIPEECCLTLQQLEFSRIKFQDEVYMRSGSRQPRFNVISNTEGMFTVGEHDIAACKWEFLGLYVKGNDGKLVWTWPWKALAGEGGLKEIVKGAGDLPDVLKKDSFLFDDGFLVSYISAFLMNKLGLDYVHFNQSGDTYSAFGVKNLVWIRDVIPECKAEIQENMSGRLKSIAVEDKPTDWESVIKMFIKMAKHDTQTS